MDLAAILRIHHTSAGNIAITVEGRAAAQDHLLFDGRFAPFGKRSSFLSEDDSAVTAQGHAAVRLAILLPLSVYIDAAVAVNFCAGGYR